MHKEVKALARQLRKLGLTVEQAQSNHVKVSKDGVYLCSLSLTPSSRFAVKAMKADLRRAGVEL